MAIVMQMRPDVRPISWDDLRQTHGPYAIAIDGYVADRPRYDPSGPNANFNHHEHVSRLETRATCAQAQLAIRLGLFRKYFRDESGPRANVFMNDCDEDVCLSWFLLSRHHIAESVINPCLNRLVDMVDKLDTTSGLYPLSIDTPILRQIAWVMEPYRSFRWSGGLQSRNAAAFCNVIEDVCDRIGKFMIGKEKELPLDTRYTCIGGGPIWAMVQEIGPYGRQGAFADGIHAFVAMRERTDGGWDYSIGRVWEFVPFDVPKLLEDLTREETNKGRWGGSTTIGGSDRVCGSSLSPERVEQIINTSLASTA